MKVELGKLNISFDWQAIAVIAGAIVIDALSRRGQFNSFSIDMSNQTLSLNK